MRGVMLAPRSGNDVANALASNVAFSADGEPCAAAEDAAVAAAIDDDDDDGTTAAAAAAIVDCSRSVTRANMPVRCITALRNAIDGRLGVSKWRRATAGGGAARAPEFAAAAAAAAATLENHRPDKPPNAMGCGCRARCCDANACIDRCCCCGGRAAVVGLGVCGCCGRDAAFGAFDRRAACDA
jgi:hypothetical protein